MEDDWELQGKFKIQRALNIGHYQGWEMAQAIY
jgi:hypothetical protein